MRSRMFGAVAPGRANSGRPAAARLAAPIVRRKSRRLITDPSMEHLDLFMVFADYRRFAGVCLPCFVKKSARRSFTDDARRCRLHPLVRGGETPPTRTQGSPGLVARPGARALR